MNNQPTLLNEGRPTLMRSCSLAGWWLFDEANVMWLEGKILFDVVVSSSNLLFLKFSINLIRRRRKFVSSHNIDGESLGPRTIGIIHSGKIKAFNNTVMIKYKLYFESRVNCYLKLETDYLIN